MGCDCKEKEARLRDLELERQSLLQKQIHHESIESAYKKLHHEFVQADAERQELKAHLETAMNTYQKQIGHLSSGVKTFVSYIVDQWAPKLPEEQRAVFEKDMLRGIPPSL